MDRRPSDEWRGLAPLQRTLEQAPVVNPPDTFASSLTSWQSPAFLAPLGHLVSDDAPAGVISGLVTPARPRIVDTGPDMPVATPPRPERRGGLLGAVQRWFSGTPQEPDPSTGSSVGSTAGPAATTAPMPVAVQRHEHGGGDHHHDQADAGEPEAADEPAAVQLTPATSTPTSSAPLPVPPPPAAPSCATPAKPAPEVSPAPEFAPPALPAVQRTPAAEPESAPAAVQRSAAEAPPVEAVEPAAGTQADAPTLGDSAPLVEAPPEAGPPAEPPSGVDEPVGPLATAPEASPSVPTLGAAGTSPSPVQRAVESPSTSAPSSAPLPVPTPPPATPRRRGLGEPLTPEEIAVQRSLASSSPPPLVSGLPMNVPVAPPAGPVQRAATPEAPATPPAATAPGPPAPPARPALPVIQRLPDDVTRRLPVVPEPAANAAAGRPAYGESGEIGSFGGVGGPGGPGGSSGSSGSSGSGGMAALSGASPRPLPVLRVAAPDEPAPVPAGPATPPAMPVVARLVGEDPLTLRLAAHPSDAPPLPGPAPSAFSDPDGPDDAGGSGGTGGSAGPAGGGGTLQLGSPPNPPFGSTLAPPAGSSGGRPVPPPAVQRMAVPGPGLPAPGGPPGSASGTDYGSLPVIPSPQGRTGLTGRTAPDLPESRSVYTTALPMPAASPPAPVQRFEEAQPPTLLGATEVMIGQPFGGGPAGSPAQPMSYVQRVDEPGGGADSPPPASTPGTTTSAPAPAAPAGAAAGGDPEELLKKLFDPLLRRLKAELRIDRERRGALTDLRH